MVDEGFSLKLEDLLRASAYVLGKSFVYEFSHLEFEFAHLKL